MTNSKHSLPCTLMVLTILLAGLLVGCGSEKIASTGVAERPLSTPFATHSSTSTSTPPSTVTSTNTPTVTITPTKTQIPTTTPFPTVTPVPTISTKTVLLGYGFTGGDGGDPSDLYYGRGMPSLVIYTDGQVIFEESDTYKLYFLETTISSDEMCNLLSQLQEYDFFEEYDPIYAFDESTVFSDGASYVEMIANGPLDKHWGFYEPHTEYLVPPLKQSFELVQNYRPFSETYYEPERLILWIESASEIPHEDTDITPWPETLPSISELWQDPINSEVLVEGEWVAPIMELFDYRLAGKLFSNEGATYHIILRPLLPHENPLPSLNWPHFSPQTFNLPFDCPDLDLPIISPTATPPAVFANEPYSDLIGKGRMLLTSDIGDNNDIYVINADGTNMLNLTNHLADDAAAQWSPDGLHIAFVSNRDGNDELYLMNSDGTDVTRVTYSPAREIAPRWSPDGTQLFFSSNRLPEENWLTLSIDIETGIEKQFANIRVPQFSPNGETMLFSVGDWNNSYIVMTGKNGGQRSVMRSGWGANWSPDGQKIAFFDEDSRGNDQLWLMNVDGTDSQQLTDQKASYSSGLHWSPDGEYIVFESYDVETNEPGIFVIDVLDGTEPDLLMKDVSVSDWIS